MAVTGGPQAAESSVIPDVWGEASLGVNFFAPNARTALYAKADVTFGDDLEGFAGRGGMRISW